MSLEQYYSIMSSILNQQHALTKLKEEIEKQKKECISVARSLGIWPIIVGIRERKRKEEYHKWSLTICDGCFDTLKSSKM